MESGSSHEREILEVAAALVNERRYIGSPDWGVRALCLSGYTWELPVE